MKMLIDIYEIDIYEMGISEQYNLDIDGVIRLLRY